MIFQAFALQLNEKRHIYDAKYKTFHITMEDLLGVKRGINSIPDYPIDVTNPKTGVTVRFGLSSTFENGRRLYGASYAQDIHSGAERYLLILWKDKAQYLEDVEACKRIKRSTWGM